MFGRFLILLLLITPTVGLSQDPPANRYAPVTLSATDRARLVERLDLFLKYQVTQQWAKQYDLLCSLSRKAEGKLDFVNRTKQAYSKWGRKPLVRFSLFPKGLLQADATQKTIVMVGCSELLDNDKRVWEVTVVEAYKERNDWFFSELSTQAPEPGNDPCRETPTTPRAVALLQQ